MARFIRLSQCGTLKECRCGRSPISKMSDNEDAPPSLWNSEVLRVKHSVGEPIPEFSQAPEKGTKVPSSVRRQDAGDVLPHQPSGAEAVSQPKIFERELTALITHSFSESRNAEGLTWGSSDEKIDSCIRVGLDGGEVAMKRDVWVVVA